MEKLKQDDIINIEIADYGMDGEGIAKYGDYTVFVPFAAVGDNATVKVVHVKKNLVFAKLYKIITNGDNRADYQCNRFMKCGGCDLMHLKYSEQIKLKRQNLINLLRKNTGFTGEVEPIVSSPNVLNYRNKIQLPFGTVNGKAALGFYRKNSHKIVSITKCFLHGEWVEKLIGVFLQFASDYNLSVYDEETGKGLLRHLVARFLDGNICIVLVINSDFLPHKENLINLLEKEYGTKYSLYFSPHKIKSNVVLGKKVVPIVERTFITNVLGVKFEINPFSFLQLNNEVRDLIYKKVIDEILNSNKVIAKKIDTVPFDIKESENKIVIDAYAGVGLLGAVLAKNGINVYNIEIVKEAVADADKLYELNKLNNYAVNICGDAALELPKLLKKLTVKRNWQTAFSVKLQDKITQNPTTPTAEISSGYKAKNNDTNDVDRLAIIEENNISSCQNICNINCEDKIINKALSNGNSVYVILDPPRKGCDAELLNTLVASSGIAKVIYISCNPATLTRDLAILQKTYCIKSVIPYDMFPQTKHLETLVCLTRKP